jgi:hypothetical protein
MNQGRGGNGTISAFGNQLKEKKNNNYKFVCL